MVENDSIVEVVYALPDSQYVFTVDLDNLSNHTILDVINKSGVLEYHPEINLEYNKVGIFAELKNLNDLVKAGDRIEIYRPLAIDPLEARRLRAQRQKEKNIK